MTRHPSVVRLIELVKRDCAKHGVKLRLVDAKYVVDGGCECGGYFDSDNLVVATRARDWWMTLAHEYCHMQQWVVGTKPWKRTKDWFFDWVSGGCKNQTRVAIRRQALAHIHVELDCERRTLQLARKLRLPHDRARYTQEANAYLMFYALIPTARVWFTWSPHSTPSIVANMPRQFKPLRWYRRVSPQYAALVFRHCLSPARQRAAWAWLLAA